MTKIRIILDSNEYIYYLANKSTDFLKLFELKDVEIFLNEIIFSEVYRNLTDYLIKYFIKLLKNPKFKTISDKIPQFLIDKYKKLGLKKGDFIIAAFCEFVNADYLISENRHFLKNLKFDKFKVVTLNEFLNIIEK